MEVEQVLGRDARTWFASLLADLIGPRLLGCSTCKRLTNSGVKNISQCIRRGVKCVKRLAREWFPSSRRYCGNCFKFHALSNLTPPRQQSLESVGRKVKNPSPVVARSLLRCMPQQQRSHTTTALPTAGKKKRTYLIARQEGNERAARRLKQRPHSFLEGIGGKQLACFAVLFHQFANCVA